MVELKPCPFCGDGIVVTTKKRGRQLSLSKAISLLESEYRKAKKNEHIFNPIAYALYQVWKVADAKSGKAE